MMLAVTAALATASAVPASAGQQHASQILVLGMHHSGTSVISNMTMMLGAYGGKNEEMLLHHSNPLKFWERRDVVALNEQRLSAGIDSNVASHYDVPSWIGYGFDAKREAERIDTSPKAKAIVDNLNQHRPWVTKDPRMCLVADEWMHLLDAPVCVIVHRCPLAIANSMMIYSHNVSIAEWTSVYEAYYASAMRACENVPTIVVRHEKMVAAPYETVKELHAGLVNAGVQGLSMPSEARISELIRASTPKEPTYLPSESRLVEQSGAGRVSQALLADAPLKAPAQPHWRVCKRKSAEAFATLLTTANRDYLRGAIVLGSSIRSFDSTRDLVALVTAAVPTEWHSALEVAGWTVKPVEEVEEFWWGKSAECSNFDADQNERWGHMATKLRLWQMTQYERVLYLDADTILTADASETFASVRGFAAEAPRYHKFFNAGVMLLTPSQATFDELASMGKGEHKRIFGNSVDCTEQGLLNSYFDGSAGREVTKLAVGRADIKAEWSGVEAPFVVHWITHVCPKPWVMSDLDEPPPSHCDPMVYAYWNRVWTRLTASATSDESSSATFGSREAARRMLRRLSGVSAGPSLVGSSHAGWGAVRDAIGRQLRQIVGGNRDQLRRRLSRRDEYDASSSSSSSSS